MTDNSSSAYLYSALLHAGVIALILALGYTFNAPHPEPKVFELVAGEGDNFGATAAPALGSSNGVKLSMPVPPAPVAEPLPRAMPIPAPAPVPVPAKAAPSKPVDRAPNFNKLLQRTESRVAARLEAKYKKELEAEKRRQITEEEFRKEHGAATKTGEGISGGVVGGSTANKTGGAGGKALTREEGGLLDAYDALLRSRLMENLDKPTDASDALTAKVEFYVAADGAISRVRIVRSSGNAEFDNAVLEAFRRTHSIGPRPDSRGEMEQLEFRMHEDDAAA